jgi:hypothetical protein
MRQELLEFKSRPYGLDMPNAYVMAALAVEGYNQIADFLGHTLRMQAYVLMKPRCQRTCTEFVLDVLLLKRNM